MLSFSGAKHEKTEEVLSLVCCDSICIVSNDETNIRMYFFKGPQPLAQFPFHRFFYYWVPALKMYNWLLVLGGEVAYLSADQLN